MREPAAVSQIDLLLKQTIRHHLIFRWRSDDEFAGGLVIWMINHRQPLPGLIRPVGAEEGTLPYLFVPMRRPPPGTP